MFSSSLFIFLKAVNCARPGCLLFEVCVQTELGQVWLGSSNTYVQYRSYGFSLVKGGRSMVSIMLFLMFKDKKKMENAEIQSIVMD